LFGVAVAKGNPLQAAPSLHNSHLWFLSSRRLFASVVSGRLAGVSTQLDVHGMPCSTSRSRKRGKRDRAGGGLSGATQDFKQAARDSGRPCCLRAEMPAAAFIRVHTLIPRCAKPQGSRRQELRAGESNVAAAEIGSRKSLDGRQIMAGRYAFFLQVIDERVVLSRS
jgi:hypothetical protein